MSKRGCHLTYNSIRFSVRISLWMMVLILMLIFISPARAVVYKCEDNNDNIIFSDEPCKKGQSSTKVRWLKNTHSAKSAKKTKILTPEQKTARKAKKNNQAYVLLSLLTSTKLELETKSLRCTLGGDTTAQPELLLSDGLSIDLLEVDKMTISYKLGQDELKVHFIMQDGYEETRTIKKPFPVISGEARLGRFSKSLEDIKQIEFFNSKKLRKKQNKHDRIAHKKTPPVKKVSRPAKADEVPVIELDLSGDVAPGSANKQVQEFTNISKSNNPQKQPQIKVVAKNNPGLKPVIPDVQGKRLPVIFANDKSTFLQRGTLSSRKGEMSAPQGIFILNNREQIPYARIKSIRVRPTADRSKLVVAVALKEGEIKMENMSKPFTRIQGKTSSGNFDYSLLELKSISF